MVIRPAQALGVHGATAIRDTLASVFHGAQYNRSAQQTLGGALLDLIGRGFDAIAGALRASPALRAAVLWIGLGLIGLIVVRFLYGAAQRDQLSARGRPSRADHSAANPWAAAQKAAADGRFTEAAHLLYGALLLALASRERLRLHPSKTAGDYVRELRARSSAAYAPFRLFVRTFEFVAYGTRECDRAQFERLRSLAEPLLGATK